MRHINSHFTKNIKWEINIFQNLGIVGNHKIQGLKNLEIYHSKTIHRHMVFSDNVYCWQGSFSGGSTLASIKNT